eukprot:10699281-Prorocentrum_lima.AAC.1
MSELGKGSVLVLDDQDAIAGIFTERDFVTKVVEQGLKVGARREMQGKWRERRCSRGRLTARA